MIWVGTLIGLGRRSPDAVTGVVFIVVFPLTFLSNAFVPAGDAARRPADGRRVEPGQRAAAGLRTLFGNPTATPHDAAWPLQHPVASSFMWRAALLAVTVPLAIAASAGARRARKARCQSWPPWWRESPPDRAS